MLKNNSSAGPPQASKNPAVSLLRLISLYGLLVVTLLITAPFFLIAREGTAGRIGVGLLYVEIIIFGMLTKVAITMLGTPPSKQKNAAKQKNIDVPVGLKIQAEELTSSQYQDKQAGLETPAMAASFEMTASRLVGVDNALALARLRIDVEQELREIAQAHGRDAFAYRSNILSLVNYLTNNALLPVADANELREIIMVCNQAVHGQSISNEDAEAVVTIGSALLRKLKQAKEVYASGSNTQVNVS